MPAPIRLALAGLLASCALALPAAAGVAGCIPVCGETAAVGNDQSSDGDCIPDASDNCIDVCNPNQCDDGNTAGVGNACDMDYNQDGTVSAADLNGFGADFGSPGPGDGNCDGTVSAADIPFFGARFGQSPGPSCCAP